MVSLILVGLICADLLFIRQHSKFSKGFLAVDPGSSITATFPDEDFWTLQTLDTFDQSDDCR